MEQAVYLENECKITVDVKIEHSGWVAKSCLSNGEVGHFANISN